MKSIILITLSLIIIGCNNDAETNKKAATTVINPNAAIEQAKALNNANAETAEPSGFVEENDMCICTKEWKPVCGENGRTYPSSCQAGCDKVKVTAEGPCPKIKTH